MNGRTYSREAFLQAKALWEQGDYGWQWQPIRRLAAERGFIYPPAGTVHDDREGEAPSQRAIVWRALVDNPRQLDTIMRRCRSWDEVVGGIIALEARLWVDVTETERDDAWSCKDEPTGRQAASSLKAIFTRIGDS